MLRPRHISAALVLGAVFTLCAGIAAGPAASPARARTIAKGLIDIQLEALPAASTARAGMIKEIHGRLGLPRSGLLQKAQR